MSRGSRAYAFVERDPASGSASLAPMVPITLSGAKTIDVHGLVDSGATINVLPYSIGEQLGAIWEEQTTSVQLSGNLAVFEARVLVISPVVGDFAAVRMAFAWARTDEVPVLLGQVNSFLAFDVCFYRSRSTFEVRPR